MKYIKDYRIFESVDDQFFKTKEEIRNWLHSYKIYDFNITDDLIVNVTRMKLSDNCIDLRKSSVFSKDVEKLPVQFGVVNCNFNCINLGLTSFKGCPHTINGYFYCSSNKFKSSEFFPEYIGGPFMMNSNPINDLIDLIYTGMSDNFQDPYECKKLLKLFNDYNVFKDDKILLYNLKEVIYMVDMEDKFDYSKLYDLKDYTIID